MQNSMKNSLTFRLKLEPRLRRRVHLRIRRKRNPVDDERPKRFANDRNVRKWLPTENYKILQIFHTNTDFRNTYLASTGRFR